MNKYRLPSKYMDNIMLKLIFSLIGLYYLIRNVISGAYADGDAISIQDCEVEVDLTPATSVFANIDSWSTNIQADPESVQTSEAYTFTHTGPIIYVGNPSPMNITVTFVYTEGATDPYQNFKNQAIGALTDFRWSPNGGASGDLQFTTSGGRLISRSLPVGPADGTTPTTIDTIVRCSSVAMGTIV